MANFPQPHPSNEGELCVTSEMKGPQVYRLPDGLEEGVLVRTVAHEGGGTWLVEEIDPPGRRWSVCVILLLRYAQHRTGSARFSAMNCPEIPWPVQK